MEKLNRACGNCKRPGIHLNGRLCGVCSVAGRGKVGEARDAALAEIRRKIETGELGHSRRPKSARPAVSAPEGAVVAAESHASGDTAVAPSPAGDELGKMSPGGVVIPEPGMAFCPPPGSQVVPVTLRLTVEISVRVSCTAA